MTQNGRDDRNPIHHARGPMPRRSVLQLGAGAMALAGSGLAARYARAADCSVSPQQTQGPYWVDEMLHRADLRYDPSNGQYEDGLLTRLSFNISENNGGVCTPMSGVWVDVWHCNVFGLYSDVAAEGTLGRKFLRGYQVTDTHGNVRFITIFPGWYVSRTIHIHFRVRRFEGGQTTLNFVSQLYVDQSITDAIHQQIEPYATHGPAQTTNANDNIYDSDMVADVEWDSGHAVMNLNVVINPSSAVDGVIAADDHAAEHANDFGGGTPRLV